MNTKRYLLADSFLRLIIVVGALSLFFMAFGQSFWLSILTSVISVIMIGAAICLRAYSDRLSSLINQTDEIPNSKDRQN